MGQAWPRFPGYAGQPGDLFMSAGWPAVIFGELVVGLFLGALWSFVWRRDEPFIAVLYFALALSFANPGLEFGLLIRVLMQRGVGLWLAWSVLAFLAQTLVGQRKILPCD